MVRKKGLCLLAAICLLLASCTSIPSGTVKESSSSKSEKLLKTMTLEEKVWQMFFIAPEDIIVGIDTAIQAGAATKQALSECPVGGIVYFGKNIESRQQLTEMIANTQSYSKIPLFISVDEEGGRVARLQNAGIIEKIPPMAQIGAMGDDGIREAGKIGEFLGEELSSLGFNMDFAPVADIITDENNTDIGDRSFGSDPDLVASMVEAQVLGMQGKNVSAVLKHFPSNGMVAANTHYETGISTKTADQMRQGEFLPFKAGIDAGADAVMTAHMSAKGLTGSDVPSSMSSIIIQDFLRGELGFDKVVITDALNMGAVTNVYSPEEAAVNAVKAGSDMLLMSPDVRSAAAAVIEAVRSGEIDEARIDESVLRILRLKEEKGLIK